MYFTMLWENSLLSLHKKCTKCFHEPKGSFTYSMNSHVYMFLKSGRRWLINITSRVPVGGKSSVCLICMKYRIIILIIIIKRLGEILLSYIAHASRTHTPLPLCGYGPGL